MKLEPVMETPREEMRQSAISAEEEEFYIQFNPRHGSHTEADRERYESIGHKLCPLIGKAALDLQLALGSVRGLPPTPETLPTPAQTAEMKESEMRLHQALEQFGLLLRCGIGGFEEWIDQGWSQLATLIVRQRQPQRQAEANRIYLSLFSKSLARNGPYHIGSITCMVNFASAITLQGQPILGVRVLHAAYILLRHGEKKEGWPDSGPLLKRLCRALINGLQLLHGPPGAIEALAHEQIAMYEAAVQQGDRMATKEAKQQLIYCLKDLGACLYHQSKYLEAEAVLERAVRISIEEEGFKPADQRLAELQGVSAKCLKAKMKEAAIAIPGGLELPELKKLYVQEAHIKALVSCEQTIANMCGLGRALTAQKDTFPDKLPKAEVLLRQVLDALLRHPEGGRDSEVVLVIMDNLKETLSGQHKYIEALSIGEKALSTLKRLNRSVNHPSVRFQEILDRQQEDLRQQKAFWKEAEAVLGPKSTWIGDEDGRPASLMFEKTVEDARKRRAASSSSSSSSSNSNDLGQNYAEYDPKDLMDVHIGAIMAGLGVTGAYARWPDLIFSFFGPQVFNKKDMDESTKGWAAIITLLVCSLPLQTLDHTQLAPGMSAIKIKIGAIGEAMSVKSELMGEAKDTMQQLATSSAEAQRQREEEEEEEKEGSAVGSKQQQEDPIPKRSKPKRICIACGAFGAKKKCSRCNQAYACNNECFLSAWHAFHKHTCLKQVK